MTYGIHDVEMRCSNSTRSVVRSVPVRFGDDHVLAVFAEDGHACLCLHNSPLQVVLAAGGQHEHVVNLLRLYMLAAARKEQ